MFRFRAFFKGDKYISLILSLFDIPYGIQANKESDT